MCIITVVYIVECLIFRSHNSVPMNTEQHILSDWYDTVQKKVLINPAKLLSTNFRYATGNKPFITELRGLEF